MLSLEWFDRVHDYSWQMLSTVKKNALTKKNKNGKKKQSRLELNYGQHENSIPFAGTKSTWRYIYMKKIEEINELDEIEIEDALTFRRLPMCTRNNIFGYRTLFEFDASKWNMEVTTSI